MTLKHSVAICVACAAISLFAGDGDALLKGVCFPSPDGYAKVPAGSALDGSLTQTVAPDAPKEILAHYVRTNALDVSGSLREGADALQGLVTLRTSSLLKGLKVDRGDFARFSSAIGGAMQKGIRAAKVQRKDSDPRSEDVLDARRLEDGSFSVGILKAEGAAANRRCRIQTSVIAWCNGRVFTVVRQAIAENADNAKAFHASSEKFILDWLPVIRRASSGDAGGSVHGSVAASDVSAPASAAVAAQGGCTDWIKCPKGFLKGVLLALGVGLVIFVVKKAGPYGASENVSVRHSQDEMSSGGASGAQEVARENVRPQKLEIPNGEISFLNSGENGVYRVVLQKRQRKVASASFETLSKERQRAFRRSSTIRK